MIRVTLRSHCLATVMMQTLRDLRNKIKTKMAAALTDLRQMQALEDALEQAQVCVLYANDMTQQDRMANNLTSADR